MPKPGLTEREPTGVSDAARLRGAKEHATIHTARISGSHAAAHGARYERGFQTLRGGAPRFWERREVLGQGGPATTNTRRSVLQERGATRWRLRHRASF